MYDANYHYCLRNSVAFDRRIQVNKSKASSRSQLNAEKELYHNGVAAVKWKYKYRKTLSLMETQLSYAYHFKVNETASFEYNKRCSTNKSYQNVLDPALLVRPNSYTFPK